MVERKFRLALMFSVALGLSSCLTEGKVNRWLKDHPDRFSSICAEEFPIKTEIIKGEETIKTEVIYQKGDSIPCPEDKKGKIQFVKCPPNKTITNTIHRTDTLKIENTAKIKTYEQSLHSFKELYNKEEKIALEAIRIAKERLKIIKSLIVILICSLGWNFRKLIFKFL